MLGQSSLQSALQPWTHWYHVDYCWWRSVLWHGFPGLVTAVRGKGLFIRKREKHISEQDWLSPTLILQEEGGLNKQQVSIWGSCCQDCMRVCGAPQREKHHAVGCFGAWTTRDVASFPTYSDVTLALGSLATWLKASQWIEKHRQWLFAVQRGYTLPLHLWGILMGNKF